MTTDSDPREPRDPGAAGFPPGPPVERTPGFFARVGMAVENALLVLLLAAMVILAVGQIALRIFFDTGLIWADELVKIMVLWVALVASVAASRNQRHLRIDLLSHFVPPALARLPEAAVNAFAAAVCGAVAWHSARYIALTLEFDDRVLLDTPAWVVQGVLPVAFALMCWHFAAAALGQLAAFLRGRS